MVYTVFSEVTEMKMQIKEFGAFTGVSVRTLHYYDEIGLLKPASVDPSTGYRYYDENCLLRMQQILFYRELDIPLKTICRILSSANYDREKALFDQKRLLILKKERLEKLIEAVDGAMKGENIMKAFDNSEFEKYKAEAKEKWGKTDAWIEHSEKTKNYSQDKWQDASEGLNAVFAEFAVCKKEGNTPGSEQAMALAIKLQNYITDHFYICTKQILAGLGRMYVMDTRFAENIDKNGEGTAAFVSQAIEIYCKK